MKKPKVFCVVGTRPEVIKMAPVILALRKENFSDVKVIATGQHNELLNQMLKVFNIKPDVELNLMERNQDLSFLTSKMIIALSELFKKEKPDLVLAQGDTTTCMVTALCCFYEKVPFAHIEAGLRSGDLKNPFPEEFNRIVADRIADLNFAPTERAKNNLLKEGILPEKIFVTGNTVIDALLLIGERIEANPKDLLIDLNKKKYVLVTIHRRESFGAPLKEIFLAIKEASGCYEDLYFIYPVHPNPNVKTLAYEMLRECPRVYLCDPLNYESFVWLMKNAYFIFTDSGGIQEEATAFGKPVLVAREKTERIEAVEAGVAKLVGTKKEPILTGIELLLKNKDIYAQMSRKCNVYGDGKASERIVEIIKKFLS